MFSNRISVCVNNAVCSALVDSGSDVTIISDSLRHRLRLVATPWRGSSFCGADSLSFSSFPLGVTTFRLSFGSSIFTVSAVIFKRCVADVILGYDFLTEHGVTLDFFVNRLILPFPDTVNFPMSDTLRYAVVKEHCVLEPRSATVVAFRVTGLPSANSTFLLQPRNLPDRCPSLLLPSCICTATNSNCFVPVINGSTDVLRLFPGTRLFLADVIDSADLSSSAAVSAVPPSVTLSADTLDRVIDPSLSASQKLLLGNLLNDFSPLFDTPNSALGKAFCTSHRIFLLDETPIRQRLRRQSIEERGIVQREVQDMLNKGVIEESSSPWASPVVLVRKKDGSWRFCIDFRKLNSVTKKDTYPLPRIDDALDTLHGASFFSSLDLRSGYWQVPMHPDDKEKTAFITPDGLYHFNVMPFGLSNAPATFERLMDNVLRGLKWHICLCYLDDILVFSSTFDEHLSRLRSVLHALSQAGLQLNHKKCHFGQRQAKVLGHIVDAQGVQPDPDKVRAVAEFPVPKNVKELQSFLGLCSYFRRFVHNFAHRAHPLHELLRKDVPWSWNSSAQDAFVDLRRCLSTPPVLAHYNPNASLELHTDASSFGLGAVLLQQCSDASRPIAYASRSLTPAERNYSTTERECLAIVWAVGKFRPYVFGKPVRVVTDHHSLCWLSGLKDPTARLARWVLKLQEFDLSIVYKNGSRHKDADALSRYPSLSQTETVIGAVTSLLDLRSRDDLITLQRDDPFCMHVLDAIRVRSGPRRFNRCFALRDALLYRVGFKLNTSFFRLVIPASLRISILETCHDDCLSGHLGFAKTYARIVSRYYWPKLSASVRNYVRSCLKCQQRKPGNCSVGLLQSVPIPSFPFVCIGMDFLGPFPRSSSGNRYILVCLDYLTRFAETMAFPRATGSSAAFFFLHRVVLRHGVPQRVITDRGKAFISHTFKGTLQQANSLHRKTSAYHPQSNGLVEKFNRTLTDMLSMYINVSHTNWDDLLPFVTFAYNSAVQSSTGFTPFRLLYGRDPPMPLDTLLASFGVVPSSLRLPLTSTTLFDARTQAKAALERSQRRQASAYNASHSPISFYPGDLVLLRFPLRRTGLASKLLQKYCGPFQVLRQVTPVNYEVSSLPVDSCSKRDIVHVCRMKPFHNRFPE